MTDTRDEVERIRAQRAADDAAPPDSGRTLVPITIVDPLLARIATLETERDAAVSERLEWAGRAGSCLIEIGRLRAENAALAARLPSPAAVRAARVKAAERIEAAVAGARSPWSLARSEREVANVCAEELFDLARTYLGTRDEGGDVDATTLAMIALDVDGLATLGELEEKARELREVES